MADSPSFPPVAFTDRPLPKTPNSVEWIKEKQHLFLQQHMVALTKSINLSGTYVLDHLFQNGGLSTSEHEAITCESNRKEQVSKLLKLILTKDSHAFDKFIESLKDDYLYYMDMFAPYKSDVLISEYKSVTVISEDAEPILRLTDLPDDSSNGDKDADIYIDADFYEDCGFTKSPDKPLNMYEENPSYTVKSDIEVYAVKKDSVCDLRQLLLLEMKSSKQASVARTVDYSSETDEYDVLPEPPSQPATECGEKCIDSATLPCLLPNGSAIEIGEKAADSEKIEKSVVFDKGTSTPGSDVQVSDNDNDKDYAEIAASNPSIAPKPVIAKPENVDDKSENESFKSAIDLIETNRHLLEHEKLKLTMGTQVIICKQFTDALNLAVGDRSKSHCFAYTSTNTLIFLPCNKIKKVGDPEGEKWYFPVKVSSAQIERLLVESKQKGGFCVYRSTKSTEDIPYNLSVTSEKGDIVHYHIHQNEDDELYIKHVGETIKFKNIHTLVDYFRLNRGCIVCRLRWSPEELRDYTPNYPPTCFVDKEKLKIFHNSKLPNFNVGTEKSAVYKGKFAMQDVIVKTSPHSSLSKIDEDDLLSEARILHEIRHENIRKLIGVCFIHRIPHIVLAYGGEENLRDYVQKYSVKQNVKLVLELFIQVLGAMKYLYEKKFIIHRDVSARNCLVCHNKSGPKVQLADFGMAVHVVHYDEYYADEDETFTYRWAAPEVLKHNKFSTKSDVWAIGVLFWEIATGGQMPYSHLKTNAEVAATVIRGKVGLPMPESSKEYKHIVKEIIRPCWNYKPEDRPSTPRLFSQSQHCLGKICSEGPFEPLYGAPDKSLAEIQHHKLEKEPFRKSIRQKLQVAFNKNK